MWRGSLFVSILLVGSSVRAQVNVEPLRRQVVEQGFGARLQASASAYAGNTQGVIFGSAGFLGVRGARHFAYTSLTGDYTKLDGVVSVAKWFAHVRHNYQLSRAWWWEEYGQIESDRFRRVNLRQLVGTGPRVGLLLREEIEIFLGASYLLEHTNLDTAQAGGRAEGIAHRSSNYLALTLRADERVALSHVTYAQPRFDAPSDINLLSVSSAELVVTQRLRSRIDLNVRYASVTPADVKSSDWELKNSLELVF